MTLHTLLFIAQLIDTGEDGVDIPTLSGDQVLTNALNIAYFLAGAIAVITIVVGGMMYAGSHGDAASIAKAKNLIAYSIAGLIVIASAFAITNFIVGAF